MVIRCDTRRETPKDWEELNPILGDGELGIEQDETNKIIKFKFGNGKDKWKDLLYSEIPAATIDNSQLNQHIENKEAHDLNIIKQQINNLSSDLTLLENNANANFVNKESNQEISGNKVFLGHTSFENISFNDGNGWLSSNGNLIIESNCELQLGCEDGIRVYNYNNNSPVRITNIDNPINQTDAANKKYVDNLKENIYSVHLSGGAGAQGYQEAQNVSFILNTKGTLTEGSWSIYPSFNELETLLKNMGFTNSASSLPCSGSIRYRSTGSTEEMDGVITRVWVNPDTNRLYFFCSGTSPDGLNTRTAIRTIAQMGVSLIIKNITPNIF